MSRLSVSYEPELIICYLGVKFNICDNFEPYYFDADSVMFRAGLAKLRGGKLSKWVTESLLMRGSLQSDIQAQLGNQYSSITQDTNGVAEGQADELEDDDLEVTGLGYAATPDSDKTTNTEELNSTVDPVSVSTAIPSFCMVDGQLTMQSLSMDNEVDSLWDAFTDSGID